LSNQKMIINSKTCSFKPGQTILEVAENNGFYIPTLCHLKGTTPTGACRVCVVEVKGASSLMTACSTPAAENMEVWAESEKVVESRKLTIELLLCSGRHNCAAGNGFRNDWTEFQTQAMENESDTQELCPAWGDCRLQELAYQYQVSTGRFENKISPYEMETVNPLIVRDFSRCILCGRCVKACNEVQVNRAISFGYRGADAKIVAAGDRYLKDSDCVFCGQCIQACPVGALIEKKSMSKWRPREVEKIRTTCPYCGVGCQQWLHVRENKIVKVTGVEDGAPNYGRLCVKGRFGYDFIHSEKRLKTPLIRENENFREASWDEALDLVAENFKQIIDTHGPDALAGVSCARSINEDSYAMQKLFRAVFKTNNIDHCART